MYALFKFPISRLSNNITLRLFNLSLVFESLWRSVEGNNAEVSRLCKKSSGARFHSNAAMRFDRVRHGKWKSSWGRSSHVLATDLATVAHGYVSRVTLPIVLSMCFPWRTSFPRHAKTRKRCAREMICGQPTRVRVPWRDFCERGRLRGDHRKKGMKRRTWRAKGKARIGERHERSCCAEITDAACFTLEWKRTRVYVRVCKRTRREMEKRAAVILRRLNSVVGRASMNIAGDRRRRRDFISRDVIAGVFQ